VRSRAPSSQLLQGGDWEAAVFTLVLQSCTENLQGTKAPESKPKPGPSKGGAIPPPARTFRNHGNRPLPQKISKNSQPRPSVPINENSRTPALGEYCT